MKKILILLFAVILIAACNSAPNKGQTEAENTEQTTAPMDDIEVAVIDVTGMHCAACEKTVNSALTDIDGVEEATVSLDYEQAKVKYSPSKVNIDDFKAAIEGKGYGVAKIEILKSNDQSAPPAE
ncbi:MAG: heavy metal-associated domain-containing protein [Bacteroidales bacterium]|nr:heavy metal-associated domain-containing protein [Bacteroidales bacterium]